MAFTADEYRAIIRLCHEAGHLKRSRRTDRWVAGISHPESVAEHSWRTAVIAYFIALAEGANPERTVTIGIFHDLAETRTGDIEYVGRNYLTAAPDDTVAKDQSSGIPGAMADAMLTVVRQAGDGNLEALCARDADKLECLLLAREYQRQGHTDVQAWIDNMAAAVQTETGQALAKAALKTEPGEWWREIAARYETVPPPGFVNLNRDGLVVICGPRLSPIVPQVIASDQAIGFGRDERGWYVADRTTGYTWHSPMDNGEPSDIGYLGRLRRPDDRGSFLYIAGIHAVGAGGVIHYLSGELTSLWRQVRVQRFSMLIRCTFTEGRKITGSERLAGPYVHEADR